MSDDFLPWHLNKKRKRLTFLRFIIIRSAEPYTYWWWSSSIFVHVSRDRNVFKVKEPHHHVYCYYFQGNWEEAPLTAWPIIKHFPSTNKINSLFSLIRQTKTSAINVNNKLAQQLTLYCVIFYYQASLKALFNTDYLYYAHLSRRLLYKSGSFFPIHERRIMLLKKIELRKLWLH